MKKKISNINFINNLSTKFLLFLSRFFFGDVKYYLQSGIHSKLTLPYPSSVFVNYVEERDILLLPYLEKIFNIHCSLYIPIHKNLEEREFKSETNLSIKKIIQDTILIFSFIPLCIRLAGGAYVKKNTLNLLKSIKRNTSFSIYEKFESFKRQFLNRKTYVFFGSELEIGEKDIETISGILRVVNEKNPEMNYVQLTLTYDYLLSKEGIVHISHSGLFQIKPEKKVSSIANILKIKRYQSTTVTPGNLFSFGIYSPEVQNGVSRHYLFYKMGRLANVIYSEKYCNISRECLEVSYEDLFAQILFDARAGDFIKYEKETKQYYGTNKLYYYKKNEYSNSNLKLENIYRYHYMQLNLFHKKFRKIWTEIEVYD